YGLNEKGGWDKSLASALNVPVEQRIRQILVNMERMRWLPKPASDTIIVANIPDFKLRVMEGRSTAMEMNIVVGKQGTNSVIFTNMLKYIVFAPYWNVPYSISKNEILPAMNRNKNYLARNNMEITGYNGKVPIVRQKPGGNNSLGKVKFLFPNSYNIYFHDTPAKSLFEKEQRAFSHGCIRLQKPFELAQYLLRYQPQWTADSIRSAMDSTKETWVTLPEAIPVFITYLTSYVDNNGDIHFMRDIYGHDKNLAERMFHKSSDDEN
ncbi:MAG: murein L,D-transpeptidase, partial [Chitinophagaceae bacterium]